MTTENLYSKQEPFELLFQMEREYKLFNIRTKDGFPLWDIIRFKVWRKIVFSNQDSSLATKRSFKFNSYFKTLWIALNAIMAFPKIFLWNAENFYFGLSRVKNEKGEQYDPYFDSFKNLLHGDIVFYETFLNNDKYSSDNRIFDILPYYKRIIKNLSFFTLRSKSSSNEDYDYIISALHQSFGKSIICYNEIDFLINDFRIEYHFYKWLLKFKKIKRVLLLNSDQKALCKAAKTNSIPIFEFQHGEIVDSSIMLNYGYSEFIPDSDIIFPDVLLTFSNIWTNSKIIPALCVEIGTNFFNHYIQEGSEPNSITIITSNEQNLYLEKLALKLAQTDSKIKIYYKLHPQQFGNLQEQKAYFKEVPNVEVISSEKNMMGMMGVSNEFIAIYSTAIYEALQSGKKVYIYKRLNFKSFKSFSDLPGVYLFDSVEELIELRKKNLKINLNGEVPQFFKPFNSEAFLNAINNPIYN